MNQQQITDTLLDCTRYDMDTCKHFFNTASLQALPREYTIHSHNSDSILWSYNGIKYYTCREAFRWCTEQVTT